MKTNGIQVECVLPTGLEMKYQNKTFLFTEGGHFPDVIEIEVEAHDSGSVQAQLNIPKSNALPNCTQIESHALEKGINEKNLPMLSFILEIIYP